MRRLRVTWLVVLLIGVVSLVPAQNPFAADARVDSPGIYAGRAPQFVRDWSRTLQARIATLSRQVKAGEWSAAIPGFLLSVVFGIVHIAGPGHGKVFAISYFSGRAARRRDAVLYSAVVNLADSLSAFVIVMLGYVALRTVIPSFRTDGPRILEMTSYSVIIAFGVVHLVSHLRSGHRHAHDLPVSKSRTPWGLAVSVGLIPCPVSTILLVFGVANEALLLMIVMVVGVSIGGFLTMSLISIAIVTGRERLLARVHGDAAVRLSTVLEFLASGVIIAVGLLLLIAAI